LADFTAPLNETIKGFHNIRWRFEQWDRVIAADPVGRAREVQEEIAWIEARRAEKVNLCNKKLRDCRIHYNDLKGKDQDKSSIFITEGLSASGSITKCRDVAYQAVFSLRGKTPNSWGSSREIVYKNEEYNLLQAALNIEEGMEGLRYNKVIIATDADDDGMHIRLLLLTFFLQFFPDLVRQGHVYILQTPLFRVRNKKETYYCYTDEERVNAIKKLGDSAEITRFKGLGEISDHEFKNFIGEDIRLDQVILRKEDAFNDLLEFYRGKNTPQRRDFIIENLVIEEDVPKEA
jgi:topoisomerase-4 subunit B